MKGLISHEESQAVAKAFDAHGHIFNSCDLQECSGGRPDMHIVGDVFHVLHQHHLGLNFYGAHPVCKFMTNSGVRWLASKNPKPGYEWSDKWQMHINWDRYRKMELATKHFNSCLAWLETIGKGYIENPIMHKYAKALIRKPHSQIVHPYFFGTPQMKATCLWIVGLPNLKATNMLTKPKKSENYAEWVKWQECWTASPGPDREKQRSKTDVNIAKAMAEQWG